ncbi:SGNH/GDSL hydrolase family protein [Gimesia fumaroli]|uniref:Multifunctional acyl-CoA thioesterase I and protease I and lysophospholipase L1 n=1 Tax=Gimesia fumaroli TaxID=2527976 RepID=A0A518I8M3_9PLAN|nr:GDSL-type esterase/lipase family protein [Gimesia fumaroli]QDV49458.1 multifunctional acyl-CoA thioesterase I and protease I and lysophospholipase L1 [Gimesia fumaroli]
MFKYCLLYFTFCLYSLPANTFAAEVINAGVGGNRSSQLLKRLDRDVLAKDPSVVVLMVGTNDRLNSGGFIDIKDYQKNVNTLIDKIDGSGAKVLLMTPPPCIPELLFSRHDSKKYADQSPNERMQEVRSVLLDISKKRKIPLVDFHDYLIEHNIADNNKTSVLRNPANSGIKDGVHLTPAGYQLLSKLVTEKLASEKLDTTKIICFGDSLTKGSAKANYPAYLGEILAKPKK